MSDDPISERIARRLRDLRARAGLATEDLAERTGVPARTISRIELGQASPTVRTLSRIAAGLGVDPIAFFYADILPAPRPAAPGSMEPLVRMMSGRSPADIDRATRVLREVFTPDLEPRTR